MESFLNKHISIAYSIFGNNFQRMSFSNNIHYTFSFLPKIYHKKNYNQLTIITNEKEIIKEINIRFSPIINSYFYLEFVEKYGKPSSVKVFDNVKNVNEEWAEGKDDDSFKQKLRQRIINTKEGSFSENPVFIIWAKENYEIHILFRREYNVSDLIFKGI